MNKKMYGDEVPSSISSHKYEESEPPEQHKTRLTKKTPKITCRAPRPTPEQPHHLHQKTPAHAKTNPQRPKARQIMGEPQKLICQTLDQWKPIPAHTNTPSTGSAATPKANPVASMPTPNPTKGITVSALYKHPQPSTSARRPK